MIGIRRLEGSLLISYIVDSGGMWDVEVVTVELDGLERTLKKTRESRTDESMLLFNNPAMVLIPVIRRRSVKVVKLR